VLTLSDYPASQLGGAFRSGCFRLGLGNFIFKVSSNVPEFISSFRQLYSDHPVTLEGGEYDFDLAISSPSLWRRWFRRNATFEFCGDAPFLPMEVGHSHALFEWGLNWVLASFLHQYLILHSAVVEWKGKGVLLSAVSGSGKSTLSAELSLQGWRLLSDELALIDEKLNLMPLARPVSLKNSSIDLIRSRHPLAVIGPLAKDTHKGTVGHLKVSAESIAQNLVHATPKLIVFPKWTAGASLRVTPVGAGQAALRLIDQAFNYSILGIEGFQRLVALVRNTEAWEIEYSSLDEARDALEALVNECG
jgi:HprK-related kinase A